MIYLVEMDAFQTAGPNVRGVTGIVHAIEADDVVGDIGQAVTSWPDRGAGAPGSLVGTGVTIAAGPLGRRALAFNGSGHFEFANGPSVRMAQRSIFIVMAPTAGPRNAVGYGREQQAGAFDIVARGDGLRDTGSFYGAGLDTIGRGEPSPASGFYVFEQSYAGSLVIHSINGVETLRAPFALNTQAGKLRVGSGTWSGLGRFIGQIAAVYTANEGLTPAGRQRILDYLVAKYVVGLPNPMVTERFSQSGYTTGAQDVPPHASYPPHLIDPGDFERSAFSSGRTSGPSSVNAGFVELTNADGRLDRLALAALDGRALRISALVDKDAPFSSRVTILNGTMEQAEVTWDKITVRLRDRMAALAKPIQSLMFKGTTTSGGMNEAEGEIDLKDKPKPILFGRASNVSPVLVNRFGLIWQVSSSPARVLSLRDNGVVLTRWTGLTPQTLAELRAVPLQPGTYADCPPLGLLRTQREPVGDLTAGVEEFVANGVSIARSVRRALLLAGLVENVDFLASDLDALHAAVPLDAGLWVGTEPRDAISVVTELLASVSAWIVPDRLGRFRIGRLVPPVAAPGARVITKDLIIGGSDGLQRLVTEDEGRGVPAKKVTIRYGRNYTVQNRSTLDATAADATFKAFASEEWRSTVAEDADVAERHLLAPELSFDTAIADAGFAASEATRRLRLYGVRRERYRVKLPAPRAFGVEIGDVVVLKVNRFGLDQGKAFVVLGETVDLVDATITLELWG